MFIRFLAPLAMASLGLAGSLFINNVVLTSPNLPRVLSLPEIRLPQFPSLKPTKEKRGQFSRLLNQVTPIPPPTAPIAAPTQAPLSTTSPATTRREAIEISDTEINNLIGASLPAGTPVKNIQVNFDEGKVLISGKLTSPIESDFSAEASLNLQEGLPMVKITKATLGPIPIPISLLSSLETQANEIIRQNLISQKVVKIEVLEIKEGRIIFSADLK